MDEMARRQFIRRGGHGHFAERYMKSIAIQVLEEQMVLWEFEKTDFETLNRARQNCIELMNLDEFKELVKQIRMRILRCRLEIEEEDRQT